MVSKFKRVDEYIEFASETVILEECFVYTDGYFPNAAPFPSNLLSFLKTVAPEGVKMQLSNDLENSPSVVILQYAQNKHLIPTDVILTRMPIKVKS